MFDTSHLPNAINGADVQCSGHRASGRPGSNRAAKAWFQFTHWDQAVVEAVDFPVLLPLHGAAEVVVAAVPWRGCCCPQAFCLTFFIALLQVGDLAVLPLLRAQWATSATSTCFRKFSTPIHACWLLVEQVQAVVAQGH